MGTNFYAVTEDSPVPIHIGKRYGAGYGRTGFIWAIEIGAMEGLEVFFNEYGDALCRADITEMLLGTSEQQLDSIGVDFS